MSTEARPPEGGYRHLHFFVAGFVQIATNSDIEGIMMDGPRQPGQTRSTMRLASLGLELAAGLGAAILLGYWIDRRFGTGPWGLVICAAIGIVGGLYNVLRQAVQESKSPPGPRRNREGGGPSDQPDG